MARRKGQEAEGVCGRSVVERCGWCAWWEKRERNKPEGEWWDDGDCHALPAFVQRGDRRTFRNEWCSMFKAREGPAG